jgi:hypothetical protein
VEIIKYTKRPSTAILVVVVRDYTRTATKARVAETARHWLRVLCTLNEAQARVFVAQTALVRARLTTPSASATSGHVWSFAFS